jgi:hypothetical protein
MTGGMIMERYRARFERNRGHFLVLEGDPAITRGDCDPFQLRMFQVCGVPGLMRPDLEEIDGKVVFRYSLQGGRMLSQAMRTAKWSMSDLMNTLSRLAEIMEDCRLYLLDAERIRLDDEWIFVGDEWRDLRLVYLPTVDETRSLADNLEKLVVRWMMHVPELEGSVVQHILRMIASSDFTPAALRRYTRGYLADKAGAGATLGELREIPSVENIRHDGSVQRVQADDNLNLRGNQPSLSPSITSHPSPTQGWRWFQPPSGEPQALSELLGNEPDPVDGEEEFASEATPEALRRRRMGVACAAIAASAVAWRWGFAAHPGRNGLLMSVGISLIAIAAAVWLWNRRKNDEHDRDFSLSEAGGAGSEKNDPARMGVHTAGTTSKVVSVAIAAVPEPSVLPVPFHLPMETGMVGSPWQADLTQQLDSRSDEPVKTSYYLEWESGQPPIRIPLQETSMVIGRSLEAAKHVDETQGVSRAHVELLRTQEGWKAKDLGSRNGTRLNENGMVPYEPYILQPDDYLVLADSRYRFRRSS